MRGSVFGPAQVKIGWSGRHPNDAEPDLLLVTRAFRSWNDSEVAMNSPQTHNNQQTEASGCLPLLTRLVWTLFGVIGLFFSAISIAKGNLPIIVDVFFWLIVLVMIGFRYLDVTRFAGQTTDGKPSTMADWRRYVPRLLLVAALLYGAAKALWHFGVL